MKKLVFLLASVALIALLVIPQMATSRTINAQATIQDPGNGQGRGQGKARRGNRQPRQEAFDACVNQSEGDACSFENRRGETMTGTCITPPRGEESLVCLPDNFKGKGRGQGNGRGNGQGN